jgi:hypothetical protein
MNSREEVNNMRMITKIADRMLNAVVPEITAGACCPENKHYVSCGCRGPVGDSFLYRKLCVTSCDCVTSCTACLYSGIRCS